MLGFAIGMAVGALVIVAIFVCMRLQDRKVARRLREDAEIDTAYPWSGGP